MVDNLNALGNKTECNSSKISPGCNLPQTYVLHHCFQQNVTNWRGNRIDQNIMENGAFQQNAGVGGRVVLLVAVKKTPVVKYRIYFIILSVNLVL